MGRQIYSQVHNAHKQALRCAHTDTWVLTDTHTHTRTHVGTHMRAFMHVESLCKVLGFRVSGCGMECRL